MSTIGDGWTCQSCQQWIPMGQSHSCPGRFSQPYPTPPMPQPKVPFTPDFSPGRITVIPSHVHDFAVGPTHAICNRCEKVIFLSDPSPSAAAQGSPSTEGDER